MSVKILSHPGHLKVEGVKSEKSIIHVFLSLQTPFHQFSWEILQSNQQEKYSND